MMIEAYLLVFVTGMVIGSFLNVCIYRLPREISIVNPPSHCTACDTRLKPLDLVPVFSYIFLKGRCRYCGAHVSIRYPLIELLTGAVYFALFYLLGCSIDFISAIFLMSLLIVVFFIDLELQIIPNELVVTGLIGGLVLSTLNIFYPMSLYGDREWWNPLLGAVVGSGFLLVVALIGMVIYKTDEAMGMGDIKILAPIGLFLGWRMTIIALLMSVFLGGTISLMLIIMKKRDRKDTIPFGPFIVIGTFITIIWGWDILNWYINRL